jgi:hypothetical protein
MLTIFYAIAPIFITIAFGWGLRKKSFPSIDFWSAAERFIYFILLPCLFFNVAYTANLNKALITTPLIATAAVLCISILLFILKPLISKNGASFTSVYQGTIRFNGYVALSAGIALFGDFGAAVMAVTFSIMVPLLNILCVLVLLRYGKSASAKWRVIFWRILTNPLILSTLLGVAFNLLRIPLPLVLHEVIIILSKAALPFGLLAVGAGLQIKALKSVKFPLFVACLLKLLVLPLIVAGLCYGLKIDPQTAQFCLLFASFPGATASYILAKQMGGDEKLMAGIVAAQTVLAAFTMPLIVMLARQFFPY